jgi:hypothetical protein
MIKAITSAYKSHRARIKDRAAEVMKQVWLANASKKPPPTRPGGESYTEPHGFLTGCIGKENPTLNWHLLKDKSTVSTTKNNLGFDSLYQQRIM